MKKIKVNAAKLQLNKQKISTLAQEEMNALNGGISSDGSSGRVDPNKPLPVPTRGNCDIPTIGHDDGPNCLSHSDWGWCWCRGI